MSSLGILRPMEDGDLDLVRQWRNSPRVRANMYTRHEISQNEHQEWWVKVKNASSQKYFIYQLEGIDLGVVGFTQIDSVNSHCSWAFYASESAPRGTGSKMEFLALEYVFFQLKMHKLHCEVLAFNTAVIELHKKFGFKVEGILKEHHRYDGAFIDIYRLGLLQNEWSDLRQGLLDKLTKR